MITTSLLQQKKDTEGKQSKAPVPSQDALGHPGHEIGKAANQVGVTTRSAPLCPSIMDTLKGSENELSLRSSGCGPSEDPTAMRPARPSRKLFKGLAATYLHIHSQRIREQLQTTRRMIVAKHIRGHNEGEDETRARAVNRPCFSEA